MINKSGERRNQIQFLCIEDLVMKISIVSDEEKAKEICTALCRKFTDDEAYLEWELKNALPRVLCLELTPEHMTGKLVNES